MNTLMPYGRTGTTKTSQIGRVFSTLRQIYQDRFEIENPIFRYVGADSGWGPIDDIVRSAENPEGFVEALDLSMFRYPDSPFGAINAVADGRWLKIEKNSKTGKNELVFTKETRAPNNLVGYAFEGFNTIADLLLQDHIDSGRKVSQEVVGRTEVSARVEGNASQTYLLGAAGQSHYGQVQRFMLTSFLPRIKSLRREDGSEVPWVIVTAHEAEGTDDLDKAVLGPASVGRAIVGSTAQRFQDTLHMVRVVDPKTGKREIRAYFWDHPEMSRPISGGFMLWPAKVSLPPSITARMEKLFPNGYIPMGLEEQGLEVLVKLRHGIWEATWKS